MAHADRKSDRTEQQPAPTISWLGQLGRRTDFEGVLMAKRRWRGRKRSGRQMHPKIPANILIINDQFDHYICTTQILIVKYFFKEIRGVSMAYAFKFPFSRCRRQSLSHPVALRLDLISKCPILILRFQAELLQQLASFIMSSSEAMIPIECQWGAHTLHDIKYHFVWVTKYR
jgi:hypothetical protein